MPHKLGFRIAHFSSEDRVMHARDLLYQGPGVRGWASARYALYPQELVFQLKEKSNLTKLQLLAHQYLIPGKIDIYIGDVKPGKEKRLSNVSFTLLGFVNLSDNEHTNFSARELKTVNLTCTGTYLKLVFHKSLMNKLNVQNQVALVAIMILGNEVENNNNSESPDDEGGRGPSKRVAKDSAPLFNEDLAFTMYVDPTVASTIEQLQSQKEKASNDKRRNYAKKLEATIVQLRLAGERLGQLEIEKRLAVDKENFDKAKLKKKQLEQYRLMVFQKLDLDDLLEIKEKKLSKNDQSDLVVPDFSLSHSKARPSSASSAEATKSYDVYLPSPSSSGVHKSRSVELPPPRPAYTPPEPPPSPPKSASPPPIKQRYPPLPGLRTPRRNLSPTDTPKPRSRKVFVPARVSHNSPSSTAAGYTDYDERQLPALKHRSMEESPEDSASSPPGGVRLTYLTDVEKMDPDFPLVIFDMSLVEKFYSKQFTEKELGLELLQEELDMYSYETTGIKPERYTRAVMTLIHRALRDKVFSVAALAAKTFSLLLSDFFGKHRVSKKEIAYTFERVLPDLLAKTADNAQRNQNLAVSVILSMLDYSMKKSVYGLGVELTKSLNQVIHPRSALCRAIIVETQLSKMISQPLPKDRDSGFAVKQLVEFGLSALNHQNGDVRKIGERILLNLYHDYPVGVRRSLPLEDEPARRNVLFRNLFEQMEMMDRKKHQERRLQQTFNAATSRYHGYQHHQTFRDMEPIASQFSSCMSTPGGSSTSSGISVDSSCGRSSSVDRRGGGGVPHISVTPDEVESRGRALSRLNSSKTDLREDEDEDRICVFCGRYDEAFTGTGLDLHYWKSCPLLTRCRYCKHVLEISSLTEHLLGACEIGPEFRICDRCNEAVPKFEIKQHVLAATCAVAKPPHIASRCPLCHENIPLWNEGWRQHLLPGPQMCLANPRTKPPGPGRGGRTKREEEMVNSEPVIPSQDPKNQRRTTSRKGVSSIPRGSSSRRSISSWK